MTEIPVPSTFGRYELRSVLGRGGMGVVYEAVLVGLVGFRKRVALKVLHASSRADPAQRAALQREARVGAMLSHPNVVAILDLGREHEHWFIAMELVDGHPVSALLRAGLIGPPEILDIALAACSGLAHVHDLRVDGSPGGLVHRDVKPQNLLVDRSGTLKIADFGITALSASASDRGGSPAWMAPEQQTGASVTASADVFSLGAVLYALAARRTPFGSGAVALRETVRVEALLADPAFLAPVDAALRGLGDVVKRCLRFDPHERYPTTAALAADLRALRPRAGWGNLGALVERVHPEAPKRRPSSASGSVVPRATVARTVGRDREVENIRAMHRDGHAVVTITGPGGIGKTRVAREVVGRSGGAAAWIDVREVSAAQGDAELGLARAVARALSVDLVQADPMDQVVRALAAAGATSIVLDGVEAHTDVVGPFVALVVSACPDVAFTLTSRVPLRVGPEQVVPLGPLSVADGALLFEQVAQGALRDMDRGSLPELVEALDGLPLAIELAAARTRTLGVPQILERMRDRFRLLVDPSRPGMGLRSTLQASFDLLRPWEVRALGELATFLGGFTLEAAEAIVKLDEWPEAPWALDVVSELLDASLLHHDREGGRFTMGHSVQQYALEVMATSVRRAAELRHGEYFAQLGAEDVDDGALRRHTDQQRRVESELENLRVACERALERGDVRVAECTAFAAAVTYADTGPYASGAELLRRVLGLPGLVRRWRLLVVQWGLLRSSGRRTEALAVLEEARAEAESSGDEGRLLTLRQLRQAEQPDARIAVRELRDIVAVARARGDAAVEGRALSMLGNRLHERGDLEGTREALERAAVVLQGIGDGRGLALATLRLGRVNLEEGRLDDARKRFDEAERGFRLTGDRGNAATAAENHAVVLTELGRLEEAGAVFEQVVASARRSGARAIEANSSLNLGELALLRGRPDEARARIEQARLLAQIGGWVVSLARVAGSTAAVEVHLGRLAAALDAYAEAERLFRSVGAEREASLVALRTGITEVAAGSPPAAGLWVLLGVEARPAGGHLWVDLGHALANRGDPESARALAGARAIRDLHPHHPPLSSAVDLLAARLSAATDPVEGLRRLGGIDPAFLAGPSRAVAALVRAELLVAAGPVGAARVAVAEAWRSLDADGYGGAAPMRAAVARLRATIGDGGSVDGAPGRG